MPLARTSNLALSQVVPVVTDAVLKTERRVTYDAGKMLAPGVEVSNIEFRIPIAPTGGLVRRPTKRGDMAQIEWTTVRPGKMDGELNRYSYASGFDTDRALNDLGPWQTREMHASRAKRAVDLDVEFSEFRPLLLSDANFGLVIDSPGWNVNDNSYDSIRLALEFLRDSVGVATTEFTVALFGTAEDAALRDQLFLERRSRTMGAKGPALEDLKDYWRVKEVWSRNPVYKETPDSAALPIYPQHAVIYYKPEGDPDGEGEFRWASCYYWSEYGEDGQALDDIEIKEASSLLTPWQVYKQTIVHNVPGAVLVKTPFEEVP